MSKQQQLTLSSQVQTTPLGMADYLPTFMGITGYTGPSGPSGPRNLNECCRSTQCCGRLGGLVVGKACLDRCLKGENCKSECDRFRVITTVG